MRKKDFLNNLAKIFEKKKINEKDSLKDLEFDSLNVLDLQTFNDSNFITCFANDYGHENWITEAIKSKCANGDLIILISSSGKSPNIINAAKYCNNNKIDLITLSGFSKNNELKSLGNINFYVNSENYNHIEMVHHIILVSMVDIIAKKKI